MYNQGSSDSRVDANASLVPKGLDDSSQAIGDSAGLKERSKNGTNRTYVTYESVPGGGSSGRTVNRKLLEKAVGKSVEVEHEPEFKELFPDCAPGTMPPFGNLYGLSTYVDRALSKEDFIVFEAGTHTDAIKLQYTDYEHAVNPFIEDFAMKLHPINRT